jgi:hypothetical protein
MRRRLGALLFTGLLCIQAQASFITTYQLSNIGDSQLITLNARLHGDPYNLAGDQTPYRLLVDLTPGLYSILFVDTVPGYTAWSPWSPIGGYYAAGLTFRPVEDDAVTSDPSLWVGMCGPYATQQSAFDELTPKKYWLTVTRDSTYLANLTDHILGDNGGGVSFVITKEVTPVPESATWLSSLGLLALLAVNLKRNRLPLDHAR